MVTLITPTGSFRSFQVVKKIKTYFILIFALCLSASSSGQEWRTWQKEFSALIAQGDTSAYEIARKIEAHGIKTRDDEIIAYGHFNNAVVLADRGENLKALNEIQTATDQFEELNLDENVRKCWITQGSIFENLGDFSEADVWYSKSYEALKDGKRGEEFMRTLLRLGNIQSYTGKYGKAIELFSDAYQIAERLNDTTALANALNSLGNCYYYTQEFDQAITYLQRALDVRVQQGDLPMIANSLNNLAGPYFFKQDYDTVKVLYRQAIAIHQKSGDRYQTGIGINNLGLALEYAGDLDSALFYYKEAQAILEEGDFKRGLISVYLNIGAVYHARKKYELAAEMTQKSIDMAIDIDSKFNVVEGYNELSKIYGATKDWKRSLSAFQLMHHYHDSLQRESHSKSTASAQAKFEAKYQNAKKQQQIELQRAQLDKAEEETKRQNLMKLVFAAALVVALIFGWFVVRSNRRKEKDNRIITLQKQQVEEKNKEILDSITYAKRLQDAILPPPKLFSKLLPESMVLYSPKDIIAGDFYWLEAHEGAIYYAAADCTGHGVPGAMVSVVCSNMLNRAVNEFGLREPGEILDKTRELVVEYFQQGKDEVKDGMDIALCSITADLRSVTFAGANNPLWLISDREGIVLDDLNVSVNETVGDNGRKLFEIKGDKQPVGLHEASAPFRTVKVDLVKGDTLYVFTDGFADQFGGPKGKKFKSKPFKELLLRIDDLPMKDKHDRIKAEFENWRGELEQIDDVCIIGVKV